ncbi:hypothetical protein U1Q18_025749 [Sarracenia purpurea var. burkii]
MEFRKEPSIPMVKDFQIPSSWAPVTPEKHILPKTRPIYEEREDNQLGHENWYVKERSPTGFSQETQAHGIEGRCDSFNSIDTTKSCEHWEAATRSPSDSNCNSSACLTEEEQVRGLMRNSCTINEAELSRTNMLGGHFNSLHEYQEMLPTNIYNNQIIPGMHFPAIYKKKRIEKVQVHSSTKSSTLPIMTVDENNVRKATLCPLNDACEGPQGKEQAFECKLALDQKWRTTKKRFKGYTRVRSLASLMGILECKPLPAFPAQRGKITGDKSSTLPIMTVDENNVRKATLCPLNDACEGPQGKEQAFECKLALDQKWRTTKKRFKGYTRVRSLASLMGILECKPLPAFPAQRGKITGDKSSTLPIMTVDENNVRKATLCPLNDACEGPQGKEQAFECKLALDQKGRTTKKRFKGSTRVRSLASLMGILECKPLPAFPAQRGKITGDMQVHEILPRPLTCVEALVAGTHATITTKKPTKRNSYASSVTTGM